MSADSESSSDEVCASCGKAEVDDTKLKKCACNLVKYCSDECQRNHRPQHKKLCKKRIAELRDDRLFNQPDESYPGECPICCLPLPYGDMSKSTINSCCYKQICIGCSHADELRMEEQGQYPRCPYCREPVPYTDEEADQNFMERVKANDPAALLQMGIRCKKGGDYQGAVEYYTKASQLGDMAAHDELSYMYRDGKGVEKDKKKFFHYLEEAAIGGHPAARYNLGCYDEDDGRVDRAFKHWIIAANQGLDEALEMVKKYFLLGLVSKENYASALRGHQAAVDATKSAQRDAAYKYYRQRAQNNDL